MAEQDSIAKGEGGGSNNVRWGEQAGPPDKLRYRFVCKLVLTAYKVYASLKKHTKKLLVATIRQLTVDINDCC